MSDELTYRFADFTRDNYRRLLQLAKQGYPFRLFTDYHDADRFIIWRHDVDHSMHAARHLARIEAEQGVQATYFLQLHSDFYNLLEREIADIVKEIIAAGHHIGLHFDAAYHGVDRIDDLVPWLERERDILEAFFGTRVVAFSFHQAKPLDVPLRGDRYAGMVYVHSPFFQSEVDYCSDSNGYWRFRRLEDVLRAAERPRLQVLTHPEWWQAEPMSPWDRIRRCVHGRAERALARYDELLRSFGRTNIGS